MEFHLYHDSIEIAGPAIYAHDLKAYAADSKRSLADRITRRRTATRSSIKTHWNNIMGRTTLPNSAVSMAFLAALLASHSLYA
jgi:hypothetical protein